MQQSDRTRATQHLLVQEFTVYPCHAAICMWLVAPQILENVQHPWVVIFDSLSIPWTSNIQESDESRIANLMREAAVLASGGTDQALCHTMGEFLLLPLQVSEVRGARMRIEAAVMRGKAPSPEKLEAFSDEMLELELAKRRKPSLE